MWKGPGFPLVKGVYGYPQTKEGIDLIKDSIRQILTTRKGERVMLRNFGSNLHKLIFEPNDELLEELVRIEVEEAIKEWEPRVEIVDVRTERREREVKIGIILRVIATGETVYTSLNLWLRLISYY